MRPHLSIRGCVRPSIGRSVRPSIRHAFVKIAENRVMQAEDASYVVYSALLLGAQWNLVGRHSRRKFKWNWSRRTDQPNLHLVEIISQLGRFENESFFVLNRRALTRWALVLDLSQKIQTPILFGFYNFSIINFLVGLAGERNIGPIAVKHSSQKPVHKMDLCIKFQLDLMKCAKVTPFFPISIGRSIGPVCINIFLWNVQNPSALPRGTYIQKIMR